MLDICFCNNKNCKSRKDCGRALENYDKTKIDKYVSMADFQCDKANSMYIPVIK